MDYNIVFDGIGVGAVTIGSIAAGAFVFIVLVVLFVFILFKRKHSRYTCIVICQTNLILEALLESLRHDRSGRAVPSQWTFAL